MSFSSLSDLVKNFESNGGDYTAVNPTSGASGAYQFLDSTWGGYAPQAGVSTILYPTAASAPPAVQDQVFAAMVNQRGLADYTCSGCNKPLTDYLAANPDQANLPIFSGEGTLASNQATTTFLDPSIGNTGGNSDIASAANPAGLSPTAASDTGAVQDVGYLPPAATGGPMTLGLASGVVNSIGGWITGIENSVGTGFDNAVKGALSSVSNWFNRGFLIFIGLVLLGLAIIWMIFDKTPKEVIAAAAA
jgi:hypothetical protein